MKPSVRIRGIYTTALTLLLLERGCSVVEASLSTARRFPDRHHLSTGGTAEVRIADRPDRQGIVLSGKDASLAPLLALLAEVLPDPVFRCRSDVDVEFPGASKAVLDDLRNHVTPTLAGHHRMRIISSDFVDRVEGDRLLHHPKDRGVLGRDLLKRLVWDAYEPGKELTIEHVKLDGREIALAKGTILKADERPRRLFLRRGRYKGGARYDGLGVPKENGDYALSELREGAWAYTHVYHRADGTPIGTYCNVNTPIECYPDGIRYVDLDVDVVAWPEGRTAVIDQDRLRDAVARGRISRRLAEKALRTAHWWESRARRSATA